MSKDLSLRQTIQVLRVYRNGETRQCIVSMNCPVYSLLQFSYLHSFDKSNNITTNLNLNIKYYFQS